jgi:magnesium transporter
VSVTVPAVNEAMIPHPQPAPGDEHTEGPVAPSVSPAVPPRCPARTRLYRDGHLIGEGFPPAEISDHLDAEPDAVVWLDLLDPDPRDLEVVTEEFGLHPLAVEDATHDHQRPKLDRYESHLFASMYAASFDAGSGQLATGEINAFITARALITVRKTHFDVDTLIARWDAGGRLPDSGIGWLVHGLLDAVVDGHAHAVAGLAEAVDALEDTLFDPRPVVDIHRRGFQLRRTQVRLRRVVLPMRELLADLTSEHSPIPMVTPQLAPYFQDVRDHVLRAAEGVETSRDVIASILETNYTEQSSQLNEITKKLAAWAAIIAVPTAVTGFYGQNVPYPGFSQHWGFDLSTAVIVVLSGGLYLLLRRQRWL